MSLCGHTARETGCKISRGEKTVADSKNVELNDELMKNASGGELDPNYDIAKVVGIIMADPRPEQEWIWEDIQEKGERAYDIGEGRIAVAPAEMEPFAVGDEVYIRRVRSRYSWLIHGPVDQLD